MEHARPTTRIVCDPEILGGKPTIRGTRISVQLVLESLAANVTPAELLDNYPRLVQEDLRAALLYAADAMSVPAQSGGS